MTPQMVGMIGMIALLALILLRTPVAVAMGLVGLIGYSLLNGWTNGLRVMGQVPFDTGSGYTLSQVPLFVFMGDVAMRSGMSGRLYDAARTLFAGVRGSQAYATIGACAGFGAVSGSSLATAATMTRVAVPEMRRAGYDVRLSTGSVAAGGTLGILIPPSIAMVVYAIIAEQPVPKLYAAGIIPGLLLSALYMLVVVPIVKLRPDWAPPEDSRASLGERLRALLSVWEVGVLFAVVLGGLYLGFFTATEAAAVGAFGAVVLGALTRRLSWSLLIQCVRDTIKTTCMLFVILFSAVIFTYFVVLTQIPDVLVAWVNAMNLPATVIMILMVVFYIILGCFLEAFGILLITVPIFLPVVIQSGFDPIWFGVLLVIVIEVGLITPPVGMNIFVMQGQLPEVPVLKLYQGVAPFLLAPLILVLALIFFPQMALWLPGLLYPNF